MLQFLRGQSTQRKLRLFLCACCRRLWARNTPRGVRQAIAVAEQYADGILSKEALRAAERETEALRRRLHLRDVSLACWALAPNAREAAEAMQGQPFSKRERRSHAALLRDIVGNPLRPVKADPDWLTWGGGLIPRLARAAYGDRIPTGTLDLARLLILADAAEEAGCTDAELLGHLRGEGPHVRGCFALDQLLG
jgi:hypothetical protein